MIEQRKWYVCGMVIVGMKVSLLRLVDGTYIPLGKKCIFSRA